MARRQQRSRPFKKALKAQSVEARAAGLRKSTLGRACAYALGQWSQLEVLLSYPRAEPHKNRADNGLRPVVLGRGNFVYIRSDWAGQKVAAIWSVQGTSRPLGEYPRANFGSVLPRLAEWPIHRVMKPGPRLEWVLEGRPASVRATPRGCATGSEGSADSAAMTDTNISITVAAIRLLRIGPARQY